MCREHPAPADARVGDEGESAVPTQQPHRYHAMPKYVEITELELDYQVLLLRHRQGHKFSALTTQEPSLEMQAVLVCRELRRMRI